MATIQCGFTPECVLNMTTTYTEMRHTGKYSQLSSNISLVWLNGWVFVYELSGHEFDFSWSHLNLRFRACFEQGLL